MPIESFFGETMGQYSSKNFAGMNKVCWKFQNFEVIRGSRPAGSCFRQTAQASSGTFLCGILEFARLFCLGT
jgi:hypothetical protein